MLTIIGFLTNLALQADSFASLLGALAINQEAVLAFYAGSSSASRFAGHILNRISTLILYRPESSGKSQIKMQQRLIFDILFRIYFFYWFLFSYLKNSRQKLLGKIPEGFNSKTSHFTRIGQSLYGDLRTYGMSFVTFTNTAKFSDSVSEISPLLISNIQNPRFIVNFKDDPLTIAESIFSILEILLNKFQPLFQMKVSYFFNYDY